MKILYAIQGTGNGHLSRARDIIPILQKKGDLDILISGTQADVELPYPVKYRLRGLCFIFGKKGGIDIMATYRKSNLKKFLKEIRNLPVEKYDLVINDFEPVSAWACRRKNVPCIGLSHQCAVIHRSSPHPRNKDLIGNAILHRYAPVSKAFGFHFRAYADGIFTPVIRSEIRYATAETKKHYTVYLPAYGDKKIIRMLSEIRQVEWEVFSKHSRKAYRKENISIHPIENKAFVKSLLGCQGILCGAGFETPAEALFLKKKILAIPMKSQYEQQCNAAALEDMGVPILKSLKKKNLEKIKQWVNNPQFIPVDYPDITEQIIDQLISDAGSRSGKETVMSESGLKSVKSMKEEMLSPILKPAAK